MEVVVIALAVSLSAVGYPGGYKGREASPQATRDQSRRIALYLWLLSVSLVLIGGVLISVYEFEWAVLYRASVVAVYLTVAGIGFWRMKKWGIVLVAPIIPLLTGFGAVSLGMDWKNVILLIVLISGARTYLVRAWKLWQKW